jgi:hypothetical protein
LWNFAAAGLLLWLSRRYEKQLKPGTIFAGWLMAAGFGRAWIEFFRPDQPKIPGTAISYSSLFAALMGILGVVLLLVRYKKINLAFAENWEEEYQVSEKTETEPQELEKRPRARKEPAAKANTNAKGKLVKRSSTRKTTKTTKAPTRTARAKKSSE